MMNDPQTPVDQSSCGENQRLPDLWPFARYLAKRLDCSNLINISQHNAMYLAKDLSEFEKLITWDPDLELSPEIQEDFLEKSLLICTSLLGHNEESSLLLKKIGQWMNHAPICLFTIPLHRCSPKEFSEVLRSHGLNVAFAGMTVTDNYNYKKDTVLAIVERNGPSISDIASNVPEEFRVVAIMTAYNEEDIIVPSIRHLIAEGVEVYLINNWSTDQTHELASELLGKGLVGIEKYPPGGSKYTYDWRDLLKRVEEITKTIDADWFIHHDVDEIRLSPWPNLRLREALYVVDHAGFNCVDHVVLEFKPIDNGFIEGNDFENYFPNFFFDRWLGLDHLKTWKNLGCDIDLVSSGGHKVNFEARRIFPYKFLIKHYPIRSQAHGEKKVFVERKNRWNPEERSMGWHVHYDYIQEDYSFLYPEEELEEFAEDSFACSYLVERLSGIYLPLVPTHLSRLGRELYQKLITKDKTIHFLSHELADAEQEILEMRQSFIWQVMMGFHNRFIEKVFPSHSKQREIYDRGIRGLRILAKKASDLIQMSI